MTVSHKIHKCIVQTTILLLTCKFLERKIGKFIEEEDEDEDFISSFKDYSVSFLQGLYDMITTFFNLQLDDNSLRILRNNIYEEESSAQSLGKIQN